MGNASDKKKFGIRVISTASGIQPHTIRVWEQRYNAFDPERTESGTRLYSEKDLQKAKLLALLLDQGQSISNLAGHSLAELETMSEILKPKGPNKSKVEQALVNKKLIDSLADYKLEAVVAELEHLRASVGAKEYIFNVILPTMRETGNFVAKGKLTVTQEHIISTIIRDQLTQIYLPNVSGKKNVEIILATPEGNLHELAIIFADILCRANRIRTHFFGAAHPAHCLAQAVNAFNHPNITLVLGAVSSDLWRFEENMIPFLERLDPGLEREIKVVLGGGSNLSFPKFKNIKSVKVMPTFDHFEDYLKKL